MRFRFSEFAQVLSRFVGNNRPKNKRSRLIVLLWHFLPTLFATLFVAFLIYVGALQPLDFAAYNGFTNWRGELPWDERIAIIAIDDASLKKLGRFPWSRDRYVQLLQKISETEASVIGFDILWSEASPEDTQLVQAIERYQRVVLAMAWDATGQPLSPVSALNDASVSVGHILKREDPDGIVRQVDLQIVDIPTLSVALLQTYDLTTQSLTPLPDLTKPLSLNWTRRVKNIPHWSFSDVIEGKITPSAFKNKILLVGVTALGIDNLSTPLDRNPPASGVHLHAMILQNLLQKSSLTIAKEQDIWSFALLGSLLISLILPRQSFWLGCISAGILSSICMAIAFIAFTFNYWIAIGMPVLMYLFTGFGVTIQERWQVMRSLRQAEFQLQYEAVHDSLTGLFNRVWVENRLNKLLNEDRASLNLANLEIESQGKIIAILCISLDRFKNINDTVGYQTGNQLLVEFGQLLKKIVPPCSTIARFDGAEFVVILENMINEQSVMEIADVIQQKLKTPFHIANHEVMIVANIGIKFHQLGDRDFPYMVSPEILLRDADTAMFYAKKLGNSYNKVFEDSMRKHVIERLQMEEDLRKATAIAQASISQDYQEFLVYYQPIVSLHNMQIVGLEALIRWRHPKRGLISPIHFIPLAEETGLIIPIGDWIMRNACAQLYDWQQRFEKAKDITISVNLSPKQLAQDDVLQKCLSILKETCLDPKYLKIELTESSIMENPSLAMHVLKKIQQAGIKIYIDDFGTGYSSLAYLHKFSFDGLKIDRSFINNIHSSANGMEILQAIITLAQSVNAHIVAEGIESLDQLNYLQDILNNEGDGQGFYLFRPIDAKAIESIFLTT
ncbi:EAL domain-containing protein [Pseudanabaena sp. FACHB-1998]|uniref:EAL domain-containing protein n=1 Tax=Pseudanabaena sp. FACHB-1998 TaxID=2692858 RepID=UPI001680F25E|nr:EAL domain-containing protein [Pseudanabaena sp. FACHB-1998]MBD2177610.1 EAL domain-containing protein [Pseudanabaena sp. FACHB-1998]